jgi:hypothetical protein
MSNDEARKKLTITVSFESLRQPFSQVQPKNPRLLLGFGRITYIPNIKLIDMLTTVNGSCSNAH